MIMNSVYVNRTFRFLLVVSSIIISLIGLFYISKITYPFLIGLAFAFFAGLITLLVAEIVSGADYLAEVVPAQLDTLIRHIEHLVASQIIPLYNQLTSLFNSLGSGQQDTIMS